MTDETSKVAGADSLDLEHANEEQINDDDRALEGDQALGSSGKLVISFIIVATAYCVLCLSLVLCYIGLVFLLAPESARLFSDLEPEQFQKIAAEDPEKIWPPTVCFAFVPLAVVAGFVFGYAVAFVSRFSHAGHAGILALIMLVSILQMALSNPVMPKWILMILMVLLPVSIIVGSQIRIRQLHP